jgi:hypothetical protein
MITVGLLIAPAFIRLHILTTIGEEDSDRNRCRESRLN